MIKHFTVMILILLTSGCNATKDQKSEEDTSNINSSPATCDIREKVLTCDWNNVTNEWLAVSSNDIT